MLSSSFLTREEPEIFERILNVWSLIRGQKRLQRLSGLTYQKTKIELSFPKAMALMSGTSGFPRTTTEIEHMTLDQFLTKFWSINPWIPSSSVKKMLRAVILRTWCHTNLIKYKVINIYWCLKPQGFTLWDLKKLW